MKKHTRLWACIAFVSIFFASLAPASQQTRSPRGSHEYEVSEYGRRVAIVQTYVSRELVKVSIYRRGRPAHHYRSYPQIAATNVQVGSRQIFTYYSQTGRVEAPNFSFNVFEVDPLMRRARADVSAAYQALVEDMQVLRAVRGHDAEADVTLAELAFVLLTGNDSIFEGAPQQSLIVTQRGSVSSSRRRNDVRFGLASVATQSCTTNPNTLRSHKKTTSRFLRLLQQEQRQQFVVLLCNSTLGKQDVVLVLQRDDFDG